MAGGERPRRGSRASMTARLLLKALLVHNGRIGVALASLAVGAAVVSALCGLYLDISIKMSEELRAYGANFILSPVPQEDAGDDAGDGAQGLPLGRLTAALQEIPAERLVGASPFLHGLARLDLGNAVIVGVDFAGLRALSPYWQVEGTWVGVSFDTRNAMVGRHLADTMELGVGDTVTIQDRALARRAEVTIRGIVDTGGREDDQLFVGLEVAGAVLGLEDRADFIMASVVAEGAEADALAAAVSAADPAVTGRPIRRISANDGEILDRIDGLMAVVAATILVITTLCVNATLTAMVAKRAPEIGLQKALGADDRAIVRQFLSETTILCVVGVTAGLILGYGLAQILGQAVFGSWVAFRPVVVPVTLGVSLAAALIAAVLPVRGAVRVAPARVLRGE